MQQTLALDVYGTLIDTSGVLQWLQQEIGGKAEVFSNLWRQKQLEYSFRRGQMNRHVDFSVCTREALAYCCQALHVQLSDQQIEALMYQYTVLPMFDDVAEAISDLRAAGHRLFAFSNGSYKAVSTLLEQANVLSQLDGVVSMEDVRTFKPSPAGYAYFTQITKVNKSVAWLISGNTFDVIGARSYGMNGAWLQRNPETVFDPMGFDPTITIRKLTELAPALSEYIKG